MGWETLLWIGGFLLLFWFMMRACGGMMGGGCGMGGRSDAQEEERQGPADHKEQQTYESPRKGP